MNPVVWLAVKGYDGENPDILGALYVEDAVGKLAGEMAADGRADLTESFGAFAGFGNQSLYLIVEPATEFWGDGGVMLCGLSVFLVGLGVERVRLHRPTIFRMRADVM